MKKTLFVVCPILLMFLITALARPVTNDRTDVTVHEWGTFTSVAGEDGMPVPWANYSASQDLPCFVYNFGGVKWSVPGTVRMETPVLYFYSSSESTANVKVSFPKGTITEWYPKESQIRSNNLLEWNNVKISPKATPEFPTEQPSSHYYSARLTDAAPLEIGSQEEKFLFYRGVGTFPLPVSARTTPDGKIVVKNLGSYPVNGLILFDNHSGKRTYALLGTLKDEAIVNLESLQDNWAGLLMDLERVLISQGLYPKEARAMIETWRDSWFEDGTRLLYIVPKQAVDGILPLDIQPKPSEISRVFVGRMEIITPATQQDVRRALANNDRHAVEKYGRFLSAISNRLSLKSTLMDSVYSSYLNNVPNCKR
jgi:hypothetical protein